MKKKNRSTLGGAFNSTAVITEILGNNKVDMPNLDEVKIKEDNVEALKKIDNPEHLGEILDSIFDHVNLPKVATDYTKKIETSTEE